MLMACTSREMKMRYALKRPVCDPEGFCFNLMGIGVVYVGKVRQGVPGGSYEVLYFKAPPTFVVGCSPR